MQNKYKKYPRKLLSLRGYLMVPVVGVEPTRYHYHRILSPARLPIPSYRLAYSLFIILLWIFIVNSFNQLLIFFKSDGVHTAIQYLPVKTCILSAKSAFVYKPAFFKHSL